MSTSTESGGTAVEHEGICGCDSYDTASSGDIHARESRVGGYGALRVEGPYMQSSHGFQRFKKHVLEQKDVHAKVCRDDFEEFVSRTLLPAINENSGKNKSWGVVLEPTAQLTA
jgi:hypothetical protein